jgi:hypothetical protein
VTILWFKMPTRRNNLKGCSRARTKGSDAAPPEGCSRREQVRSVGSARRSVDAHTSRKLKANTTQNMPMQHTHTRICVKLR